MFILNVGATIRNTRRNVELAFPRLPSISELAQRVNETFSVHARLMSAPGQVAGPFRVTRFSFWDDTSQRWLPLLTPVQLVEWGQVYAFQPGEMEDNVASAAELPSAQPLPQRQPSLAALGAAPRHSTELTPEQHERRCSAIFRELDVGSKGYANYDDFRRVLQQPAGGLLEGAVTDLFNAADANRDGRVDWPEWLVFYLRQPKLMDSLYYRTHDYWSSQREHEAQQEQALSLQRLREQQLRAESAAVAHVTAQRDLETAERRLVVSQKRLLEEELQRQAEAALQPAPGAAIAEEARILAAQAQLERDAQRIQQDAHAFRANHGWEPGSARREWSTPGRSAQLGGGSPFHEFGASPLPPNEDLEFGDMPLEDLVGAHPPVHYSAAPPPLQPAPMLQGVSLRLPPPRRVTTPEEYRAPRERLPPYVPPLSDGPLYN
eukprot:TRINITY_DN71047_c0_g1_i1.p1 TRINITY_DN71047_c0_g1~~TRINITY_DN71047_c0_g1_i1.p1  ORF type:complete len:461 (+),score=149.15 TRINITY_DN71047_c0_g1_i1:80-1384(+)